MAKSVQGRAKTMLREMWQAPSLPEAASAYDQFCTAWKTKYPKAVATATLTMVWKLALEAQKT